MLQLKFVKYWWQKSLLFIFVFFFSLYAFGVTMTHYTNPLDIAAVARVKALDISPNTPYYHVTPIPNSFNRYKNFPHQAPLSVDKAENQWPGSLYQGTALVEIGDNYQYKVIIERPRKLTFVVLPKEQFKELDNGVHFFTLAMDGTLHLLSGAEEALQHNNYLRVEKEMGKVIGIEKKPLIQHVVTHYEYWPNGYLKHTKSEGFDANGDIYSTIEVDYRESDGESYYLIEKNREKNVIKISTAVEQDGVYRIEEVFNDLGIKTNHIVSMENGDITNQHLDEEGNVKFVTSLDYPNTSLPDFVEQEPYKSLPIDLTKSKQGQ